VLHLRLIILFRDVSVDSEPLLIIDFMNLKIKPTQSFKGAHRDKVYMHVFIRVSAHIHMSICVCVCTMFLKKTYQTNYFEKFR
jgi:hypothetical protein